MYNKFKGTIENKGNVLTRVPTLYYPVCYNIILSQFQIYLENILPSNSSTWYLDINIIAPDKHLTELFNTLILKKRIVFN